MFSTKGRLAVTFFFAVAILLISALGVDAGSAYGNNEGVYWDLVTNSLYRSGNYTYSTHQWFIENYHIEADDVVLIQQEFRHRIMRVSDDGEEISKLNGDVFDTVTIPHTESERRVYRWKVNISTLDEGDYYIHAYTLIDLKDIDEDPVPEAHEYSSDFEVE